MKKKQPSPLPFNLQFGYIRAPVLVKRWNLCFNALLAFVCRKLMKIKGDLFCV